LQIRLKRKRTSEKVERLREKFAEPLAKPIRDSLARWIGRIKKDLGDAEPALPEQLNDRQQDGAEPLLAIADAAGGDWPEKARKALIELYTGGTAQDDSIGVKLLADIREMFGDEESIFSRDLVRALNEKETSPWGEWGKTEKGLTQHSLASKLKPFEIEPKKIRIGEATGRGYLRADFTDAWERYLNLSPDPVKPPNPPPPVSGVEQPAQRSNDAGKTHFSGVEHDLSVPLRKSEESPMFTRVVPLVPLEKPGEGEGGPESPEQAVVTVIFLLLEMWTGSKRGPRQPPLARKAIPKVMPRMKTATRRFCDGHGTPRSNLGGWRETAAPGRSALFEVGP